ncbi:MAG TPA: metallophosphoesterase [Candidatus Omnitrophota bacterium]|nr:metallophosphoesterase [Candidatus Omnitrophota bacterium]HPS20180.1 metallophosphoesterase [Candidatus Omnitrophota bacterium]
MYKFKLKEQPDKKKPVLRIVCVILAALVVYSFLPLIPFWSTEGAPKSENNAATVDKLTGNSGVYFSFIVFGDNHAGLIFDDAATIKEIWHMNREDRFRKVPIDFIISVGDLTLDGAKWQFDAFKRIQKMIKWPVVAAIGNHDDLALFKEYMGSAEFTFTNRNSYFIVLENEKGNLTESQFIWFEDKLKKANGFQNIFVIMHKPPFDPYQQDWYNMDNMPWAYRFRKLCAQYGVKMVFSGHRHMFAEQEFDGVKYIVTGGGGMLTEIPDADGGYLHYVRVMVNNDYVTYEVRKVSPPLWEYLTYYFWKEAVYWVRNFYGSGYLFGRNTTVEPIRVQNLNDKEYWFYSPEKK